MTTRAPQRSRLRYEVERRFKSRLRDTYHAVSLPLVVVFLFYNHRSHPAYGMTWPKKFALALRMYRNTRRIPTATSYKAHLAMATKLLEVPPSTRGAVVECGCWLGGSTANLSLLCELVGRDLIVYDSFEGLPPADPNDRHARPMAKGLFRGDLESVKRNVQRYGSIDRCQFRRGWFKDTLPHHDEPIVCCLLDVDFDASLYDCVTNLWPHLTPQGYVFIDEYASVDYCALFFSENFWRRHFDAAPPGLYGSGTGIALGQYFVGPREEAPIVQDPRSIAFTRKDSYARWDYERETT